MVCGKQPPYNSDALNIQPISIQMRELSGLLRQRNQVRGSELVPRTGELGALGSRWLASLTLASGKALSSVDSSCPSHGLA